MVMQKHTKYLLLIAMTLTLTIGLSTLSTAHASNPFGNDPYSINGYVAGNPYKLPSGTGYNGYGSTYPYANYTSVLPQFVTAFIYSPNSSSAIVFIGGNQTVQVQGGVNENGRILFTNFVELNFTLPTGATTLSIEVSSSALGKTTILTWEVNVLTITDYVTYVQNHESLTYKNPISNFDAVSAFGSGVAITVLVLLPVSERGWLRYYNGKGGEAV